MSYLKEGVIETEEENHLEEIGSYSVWERCWDRAPFNNNVSYGSPIVSL